MSDELVLKKANSEGLAEIENILKQNYLVYEDLENKSIELFKAYINSNFIGIIGLEQFDDIGLLRSMVILEKYRKKGLGRELCNSILNYAKDKKIRKIYLLTVTARKFFEKIGFNAIKRKNAPDKIKKTEEFIHLCPDSAVCMEMDL